MLPAKPDLMNAAKVNADAFMNLSQIAFSCVERLASLNLNATRSAFADSSKALGAISPGQDKSAKELLTSAPTAVTQNTTAYLQSVQEIATHTQAEVTKLVNSYLSSCGVDAHQNADWMKGFEMFKDFGKQITAMTDASSKAVGEAAARLSSSAASMTRKGA